MTKSKPSTVSDTDIKKTSGRWYRLSSNFNEIDRLFDLYWGGKERRITGMTLRIMGVNALAVVTLVFGVVYLGQHHSSLIESKLEQFKTEIVLVAKAFSALSEEQDGVKTLRYDSEQIINTAAELGWILDTRILIFNDRRELVVDTAEIEFKVPEAADSRDFVRDELQSVEILKSMAAYIAGLFPKHDRLENFPGVMSKNANDYQDARDAFAETISISAWRNYDEDIVLTGAMPIFIGRETVGAVMLVNADGEINAALGRTWFNILKISVVTLMITILLSIYLSGVIARPLRNLANAAEGVRKGKVRYSDIPDMSDRHDEIGELSLVLRDMTHALGERMDMIESFAADVSHEIKNPLTSLKSAVETARVVKDKKSLDKLLDVIRHDIERLDRLITDISNASRLDSELSRELFTVVNVKKMLRDMLDAYKSPLEREADFQGNSDEALKDGVMITLDLPDYTEIYVLGSEGRLIQVFQNILSNALSFSPLHSTIRVRAKVKNKRVTIILDDEGPGIPESKLDSIFDRFYSERPRHEEYGRHSGLGLSICKQIVSAHNGMIYAENRTDRSGNVIGARFSVVLNAVKPQKESDKI